MMQVQAKAAALADAKALERGETPPGQGSDVNDADHADKPATVSVPTTLASTVRRRSSD
jgi:hypothetical protein